MERKYFVVNDAVSSTFVQVSKKELNGWVRDFLYNFKEGDVDGYSDDYLMTDTFDSSCCESIPSRREIMSSNWIYLSNPDSAMFAGDLKAFEKYWESFNEITFNEYNKIYDDVFTEYINVCDDCAFVSCSNKVIDGECLSCPFKETEEKLTQLVNRKGGLRCLVMYYGN